MRIIGLWLRPLRFLGLALVLFTLLPWACTRKTVSFNSNPEQPIAAVLVPDSLTRTSDSLKGKPSLSTASKAVLTKEQDRRRPKTPKRTPSGKSKKKKKKRLPG